MSKFGLKRMEFVEFENDDATAFYSPNFNDWINFATNYLFRV